MVYLYLNEIQHFFYSEVHLVIDKPFEQNRLLLLLSQLEISTGQIQKVKNFTQLEI